MGPRLPPWPLAPPRSLSRAESGTPWWACRGQKAAHDEGQLRHQSFQADTPHPAPLPVLGGSLCQSPTLVPRSTCNSLMDEEPRPLPPPQPGLSPSLGHLPPSLWPSSCKAAFLEDLLGWQTKSLDKADSLSRCTSLLCTPAVTSVWLCHHRRQNKTAMHTEKPSLSGLGLGVRNAVLPLALLWTWSLEPSFSLC